MAKNANKSGSIRKRPDGRWEARYVVGHDPGTGKLIRRSIYGATQKEVRQKLTSVTAALDSGAYTEPTRLTVAQWLSLWLETYCVGLKPMTLSSYESKIKARIAPYIGAVRLAELSNIHIQKFYNQLSAEANPLSPKSIQNIHGILHKALDQAVAAKLISSNPADRVKLPKGTKAKLRPLMDDEVAQFLAAAKGDRFERLFILALFSGMRQSELLALEWTDIDFDEGTILVRRQLQRSYSESAYIYLDETKNGKSRISSIPPSVVRVLKAQKRQQAEWRLAAGPCWVDDRGLVFTDEIGQHLRHHTVYNHFKKLVASIGLPEVRFHDLRHSYAINALQAGDSIKDVQEQLGHYSSAFTMDTYAAVSATMRKASQQRMEQLFQKVSDA